MPILRRLHLILNIQDILTLVAFLIFGMANVVDSWTGTVHIFPDYCEDYSSSTTAPDQPTIGKTDASFLVSHDGSNPLREIIDCYLTVQAWRSHHRLFFQLNEEYIFEDSVTTGPTPCNWTRLEVFDYNSNGIRVPSFTWCAGEDYPHLGGFESVSNFVSLRLVVTDTGSANLTFVYSSFHTKDCSDELKELKCNNGRCMPREVRCDFANNCGDQSDQLVGAPSYCPPYVEPTSIYFPWWISLIIAALLLSFAVYWLFWRPGYIPWRLAFCRNIVKDCLRSCCAGCCQDCVCRCNSAGCRRSSPSGKNGGSDGDGQGGDNSSRGGRKGNGESSSSSRSSCCPCFRNRGTSSDNRDGKGGNTGPGDTRGVLLPSKPGLYHNIDNLDNGDGGHVREGR